MVNLDEWSRPSVTDPPLLTAVSSDKPRPTVMQRENERSRTVVVGRRTDDGTQCSLLLVHEVGGAWALYPHGARQFGVRLSQEEAAKVAQAILADS